MIAIVDYGLGNIKAFANIYNRLNIPFCIAKTAEHLGSADKIILPGVGSFDHAMRSLDQSGMRSMLEKRVLEDKVPVLGICVGMQMLANSSEEGTFKGLGWIKGAVRRLDTTKLTAYEPLPHMGWNGVQKRVDHPLLRGLADTAYFYFLHSYCFSCESPDDVLANAHYGIDFDCIIGHENIYGIQCHPEKSHQNGILVLKNFGNL